MVLPYANSLVSIILLAALLIGGTPATVKAQTARQTRASAPVIRYGLGFLTFPQMLKLNASDGRTIEVASSQVGPVLSADYEKRYGRMIYVGGLGVSYMSMKNTSQDSGVDYTAGTDYPSIMGSIGAHYLTASSVKVGASLWLFYNSFDLPAPSSPGVTYSFDYGSPLKNFISVDLNWQIYRGWILSQSLLSPLNNDMRTGWLISLKTRF